MLKTTSLGVDNPKRSHIDPILRKYIWVDSDKKKYIKEKNQFKQVTKYKGQYVVKKQKAGSTSQKGGLGLENECNEPNNDIFFYKTEFNHDGIPYVAYILYYKYNKEYNDIYKRKYKPPTVCEVYQEYITYIEDNEFRDKKYIYYIVNVHGKILGKLFGKKYKIYKVEENSKTDQNHRTSVKEFPILKIDVYKQENLDQSLKQRDYARFIIYLGDLNKDAVNKLDKDSKKDTSAYLNSNIDKLKKYMDALTQAEKPTPAPAAPADEADEAALLATIQRTADDDAAAKKKAAKVEEKEKAAEEAEANLQKVNEEFEKAQAKLKEANNELFNAPDDNTKKEAKKIAHLAREAVLEAGQAVDKAKEKRAELEKEAQGGGYKQIPNNKKSVLNKFIKSLMLIGNAEDKKKAAKTAKAAPKAVSKAPKIKR